MKLKNKDRRVYVASPFFDDVSKEFVGNCETFLKGMKIPYFSPREDGVNFNSIKNPIQRSKVIREIFNNNVENLDWCNEAIVNLNRCNGKIDIGTLWEFGYLIGKENIEFTIHGDKSIVDLANRVRNSLSNRVDINDRLFNNKSVILANSSEVSSKLTDVGIIFDIKSEIKTFGLPEFNGIQSLVSAYNNIIIIIDDFPIEYVILMGFLYAKEISYYTASLKNYGSNVMIAASSKGHIQIPSFIDYTTINNLE